MKNLTPLFLSLSIAAFSAAPAGAQTPASPASAAKPAAATVAPADLTAGQIRKVDAENNKVTIKHGEIKNLGMPAMSMVFQLKDTSWLGKIKTGDKILFAADKVGSAYIVTHLQMAP